MSRFGQAIRDHVVELGGLPPGNEQDKFKAFCTSLFVAGGMLSFGMAIGLFGYVLGVGAMVAGDAALGQILLTSLSLWAGATAGKSLQAAARFAALIADNKPGLPVHPRPATRALGQKLLPLAAGAGVALGTSFYLAAKLPEQAARLEQRLQMQQQAKPVRPAP